MMKKVIILSSVLSLQVADLHAMKGKSEYIEDRSSGPKRVSTPLHCASLPKGQEDRTPISYPQKAAMNLAPLYEKGLSGHGQTLGLIEPDRIEDDYPGLKYAIISKNSLIDKVGLETSHASRVAQVAVSSSRLTTHREKGNYIGRDEYIGIAPNSSVLFGNQSFVQDGMSIDNFRDAIALQVLKGATCINLSMWQFLSTTQTPSDSYMEGISYALREGVPVFMAAGNNMEEIGTNPFLKEIVSVFGENRLLTLCAGYTCHTPGFTSNTPFHDRKDIRFARSSARGSKNHPRDSLPVLAAPFHVKLFPYTLLDNGESQGTSFSAPGVAGTYLLLAEYADSIKSDRGIKISAKDIMSCLKKAAYKPEARPDEDIFWYGSGCVDGGAALGLLEKIASAHTSYKEKEFTQSAVLWQEIIENFGPQCPEKYVISGIQAQMESGGKLDDYLRKIIGVVEENYTQGYVEDVVEAYRLFQAEDYENAWEKLDDSEKEMKKLYRNRNNIQGFFRFELKHGLHHFINRKTRPGYLVLRSAEKKFQRWGQSFLNAERAPYKKDGELLPLNMHMGDRILGNLLEVCEKYEPSQLGADTHSFRWSLESAAKVLKDFSVPQETLERITRLESKFAS